MTDRIYSWYGDDFTGSTDALEAVAARGIPSVLFLDPPDEALLAKFADCQAVGIAGESRSRGPAWMDAHLPGIFESLRALGAPICHYKVCSTFDSSPEFGNIGRALEIGQRVFGGQPHGHHDGHHDGQPWVPIVVAAPHLKRYVLFGNLYAAAAGTVYRIDRHPTMSRHPVTPMLEADLLVHLARQTDRRIELVDILAADRLDEVLATHPDAVLFDGLGEDSLAATGRAIWERRAIRERGARAPMFCVGSSGLAYALMFPWQEAGLISRGFTPDPVGPVDQLIVISGSCSPATEVQLRWAMEQGYVGLRADASGVISDALAALGAGRNVVIYSALGPADCAGGPRGEELGRYLGTMLRELVRRPIPGKTSGVRRVAVAGGDTSSHAVRQLGIEALVYAGPLSPGAPLCRGYSADPAIDGLEIVLKGGQVGPPEFFEMVRKGK